MRKRLLISLLVSSLATMSVWGTVTTWTKDVDHVGGCKITFDSETHVFTIEPVEYGDSTGVMREFTSAEPGQLNAARPWHSIRYDVHTVIIKPGMKRICPRAFNDFYNISGKLVFPEGVESIGISALQCRPDDPNEGIDTIVLPSTLREIEGSNFANYWSVTDVFISANPENLTWTSTGLEEFFGWDGGYKTVRCHVPAEYLDGYIQKWAMQEELETECEQEAWSEKKQMWVYIWVDCYETDNINVSFAPIASELSDPWETITPWEGQYTDFFLNRTLYKDGYFNTLCLPFNLSASEIAASPIAGGELFTYTSAEVVGEAQLDIHISPATAITAGVPYLIRWNSGEDIMGSTTRIKFEHVFIPEDVAAQTITSGDVQFIGFFEPTHIDDEDEDPTHSCLFLGGNNTLYWPINDGSSIKGFRAYFKVNTGSGASNAPRRGMSASFSIDAAPQVTTDIENTSNEKMGKCENEKFLRDGQLFIIRNGIIYDAQGQLVRISR